jgi:molybdopterin-guanine dinucleotide biosynthesis protein
MSIVVIGGHSRNVGKTSVVAGLIAAMPEHNWTAIKITQYGHGICSVNGKQCHCAVDDHRWAITEERDRSGASDTSRFLVAGAQRSLWVRTKQGRLSQAMPGLRRKLASTENTIIESNSVLGFLQPDVYLTVLDSGTQDFKASARKFLELADAVILHDFARESSDSAWPDIPAITIAQKPAFHIRPPHYVTPEIVEFVRQKIGPLHAQV